ncbi:MAG: ABC transporter ATP-binding protein [Marmoricola sp.]
MAFLEAAGVTVDYRGGANALSGVDLTVERGQLIGVVGRNGSGKTSLLRAIAGFLPSELVKVGGSVRLEGKEIAGRQPGRTGKLGVALVLERDKAFANLTVDEHFRILGASTTDVRAAMNAFPALEAMRGKRAGYLSGGERQMLALALAIARSPRLLLVDEMSLGLAPIVVAGLLESLVRLRDEFGLTVILVEQDTSLVVDIADYIVALGNGRVISSGPPSNYDREAVRSAYFEGEPA